MTTRRIASGVLLVMVCAWPASADWLFTGYVASLSQVKTSASMVSPMEKFDDNVGVGVNIASAFPARANLGFEFDLGVYPEGLHSSDEFETLFASRLMSISTNFFYSPAVPRVRPYFSVGPNFGYRWDHGDVGLATPSGWAVGLNSGVGIIAFINQRIGGRLDLRYFRNFGGFYDLREDVTTRRTGWSSLQFIRVSVGATVVL